MSANVPIRHREGHKSGRVGWLRASVLGANDGIVSTASLVVGVAAAAAGRNEVLLAGVAGLVSGALSMAAGEYVSVSSQADAEGADLAVERAELATQPAAEEAELTAIYVQRGLEPTLARTVAEQLMAHDALAAHARDELGLSEIFVARPLQAAAASAATFAVGAALPILTATLSPPARLGLAVSAVSLVCLAGLGAIAARAGGASAWKGAGRVAFWGALAADEDREVGPAFGDLGTARMRPPRARAGRPQDEVRGLRIPAGSLAGIVGAASRRKLQARRRDLPGTLPAVEP